MSSRNSNSLHKKTSSQQIEGKDYSTAHSPVKNTTAKNMRESVAQLKMMKNQIAQNLLANVKSNLEGGADIDVNAANGPTGFKRASAKFEKKMGGKVDT